MKKYKEYLNEKIKVCLEVPHPFYPLVILASIIVIGGSLFLYYSDDSVPGELLFPLDTAFEETRTFLTFSGISRGEVVVGLAEERIYELDQIRESHISGTENRGNELFVLQEIDQALNRAVVTVQALEQKYRDGDQSKRVTALRLRLLNLQAHLAERLSNKDYKLNSQIIETFLKTRQEQRGLENPGVRLEDYLK